MITEVGAEKWHGTGSGYSNHGCRCDECRSANTARILKRRAERHEFTRKYGLPETVAHGNSAYRNWGCRCDDCRSANTAAQRAGAR